MAVRVGEEAFGLQPLAGEHLEAVFALYSDPRVWTHLPDGRHTDRARSLTVIDRAEASRSRTGLGSWAVIEQATARFAGTAGVDLMDLGVWNLGFRLHPDFHGRGLATAVGREALAAAHSAMPAAPVVARVLERNAASIRVLERAGLALAWGGSVPAADGATLDRRVYADRPLPHHLLDGLIALG